MKTPTKATAHSVYDLNYHIVLVTKYRHRVLEGDINQFVEEQVPTICQRYGWECLALGVMPEHVHLLVSEPDIANIATVIGVLKQITSRQLKQHREAFWETRYHDRNVFTPHVFRQKLRYLHRNPVARGLVTRPEDWPWSSYSHSLTGVPGAVEFESWWTEMARKGVSAWAPAKGRE